MSLRDVRRRKSRYALPFAVFGGLLAGTVIAYAIPDRVRIPHVQHDPALPNAVFSHRGHAQYQCYACHPSVFPQARVGFTHAQMEAGQFCGECHNGKSATAVADHPCGACHAP